MYECGGMSLRAQVKRGEGAIGELFRQIGITTNQYLRAVVVPYALKKSRSSAVRAKLADRAIYRTGKCYACRIAAGRRARAAA